MKHWRISSLVFIKAAVLLATHGIRSILWDFYAFYMKRFSTSNYISQVSTLMRRETKDDGSAAETCRMGS